MYIYIQSSAAITRAIYCDITYSNVTTAANINQISNLQKASHISSSWARYGASVVKILEKIDRVITAPH